MAKHKRTLWDDLVELGQEALKKLDEALHPEKKRKLVRVPVPIPVRGKRQPRNPYNDPHNL